MITLVQVLKLHMSMLRARKEKLKTAKSEHANNYVATLNNYFALLWYIQENFSHRYFENFRYLVSTGYVHELDVHHRE